MRPGSQGVTQQSQEVPLPLCAELPTLEEVHITHIPTFTWVPKSARGDFSRVMAELYNKVVNNRQNVVVWSLFYMFPKCILYAVTEKNKRDNMTLTKAVEQRLARLKRGGEEYRKRQFEVQGSDLSPRRKLQKTSQVKRRGMARGLHGWHNKASTLGQYRVCCPLVWPSTPGLM